MHFGVYRVRVSLVLAGSIQSFNLAGLVTTRMPSSAVVVSLTSTQDFFSMLTSSALHLFLNRLVRYRRADYSSHYMQALDSIPAPKNFLLPTAPAVKSVRIVPHTGLQHCTLWMTVERPSSFRTSAVCLRESCPWSIFCRVRSFGRFLPTSQGLPDLPLLLHD